MSALILTVLSTAVSSTAGQDNNKNSWVCVLKQGNKHPISTVKWIATRMETGQVLSISVKRVVPNREGRPSIINCMAIYWIVALCF